MKFGRIPLLASLALLASPAPLPVVDRRPSLLLVSLDTVRADHLGAYGYARDTSPFIDSLAAHGLVFDNAMTVLPGTAPAHASLLTAVHPAGHGLLTNTQVLRSEAETMAEVLSRSGYHTLAAVSVFFLGEPYGFAQGFDGFSLLDGSDSHLPLRRQLELYARLEPRAPLFLFVHFYDAHAPYERHPGFEPGGPLPVDKAPWRTMIDAYDSEVRFVDERVRRVFRRLEKLGLDTNLIAAITADHGEQLGEHGFAGGHADIYRETVRVPLVLLGPGVGPGRRGTVASLLDVAPTLLARAGARFRGPVNGVDLLAPAAEAPAARERSLLVLGYPTSTRSAAVVQGAWAFIWNLDHHVRDTFVRAVDRFSPAEAATAGYRPIEPRSDGGELVFDFETPSLEPGFLDLVLPAAGQGCKGSLNVSLYPGLTLFATGLPLERGRRLEVPVSALDRGRVEVSPPDCAERGYVRFLREPSAPSPSLGPPRASKLYADLLSERKSHPGDELYRFAADSEMLENLAGREPERAARMQAELKRLLQERRALGVALYSTEARRTPAETELLRSLGYVR